MVAPALAVFEPGTYRMPGGRSIEIILKIQLPTRPCASLNQNRLPVLKFSAKKKQVFQLSIGF